MKVSLVNITQDAEHVIAHCARVSNPDNQSNEAYAKLLQYCLKHKHWSIFEMADMTLEIETNRAIAAQLLRHRSFNFQEFSQRYSEVSFGQLFEGHKPRRQDMKNRQNSLDDLSKEVIEWWYKAEWEVYALARNIYKEALSKGIAKECARFLLPLSATTKLFMKGNVRSWIHYIQLRTDPSTQLEHRQVAEEAKKIFITELPTIAEALEW